MPRTRLAIVAALSLCLCLLAGCNTDMVVSPELKKMDEKRVFVAEFTSEDPGIGQVIRDILIKEMLREGVQLTTEQQANLVVNGAAFLTDRSSGRSGIFTSSSVSTQAIESVSLVVKTKGGSVMASASYDNEDRDSAATIGKSLGEEIAEKLK